MTKAYLIGNMTVTDPSGFAVYSAQVPKIIEEYGGKYLVRGGVSTQIEGGTHSGRNVVIEFPSRAVAEAWYSSEAYQSIIHHRQNNAKGTLVLVDGYALE
jgi:uncharacterized protein (DUF1330 family)